MSAFFFILAGKYQGGITIHSNSTQDHKCLSVCIYFLFNFIDNRVWKWNIIGALFCTDQKRYKRGFRGMKREENICS